MKLADIRIGTRYQVTEGAIFRACQLRAVGLPDSADAAKKLTRHIGAAGFPVPVTVLETGVWYRRRNDGVRVLVPIRHRTIDLIVHPDALAYMVNNGIFLRDDDEAEVNELLDRLDSATDDGLRRLLDGGQP